MRRTFDRIFPICEQMYSYCCENCLHFDSRQTSSPACYPARFDAAVRLCDAIAMGYEKSRDGYVISDDQSRLDLDAIHGFLKDAYWSEGVPRDVVVLAVRHSLAFGLYDPEGILVGFGRSVTDRATFAYLADVFILPAARGKGLGRWLVAVMMDHPDHAGLRHMILATNDAHGLYKKFGFHEIAEPTRYLHKLDSEIYKRT